MACGSVAGALLAAGRGHPRGLLWCAALFGLACALAAVMPNYWLFGRCCGIGIAAQTYHQRHSSVQRRRTAIGPLDGLGWPFRRLARRWAHPSGLGGRHLRPALGWHRRFVRLAAALVGVRYLVKHHQLRLNVDVRRWRFAFSSDQP